MEISKPTDMNRFSIKDIENLTGIKAHTIRIWEQRYGILQPKRTPTNIRYYDADDLKSALRISLLNNFGYKISRIHQMTDTDMDGLIQKISDEEFKVQILANEMLEATLALDMHLFENIINTQIRRKGLEATMEGLIFQFLEKIGLMWVANHLVPAQEHLASNVLYRKLAVAIESLPQPDKDATKVLLFLPEGEVHEMALMYVQYLLRKGGKLPIYLGPNAPIGEVELVYNEVKPAYVYTHLTAVAKDWDPGKYLRKLAETIKDTPIMVSGGMAHKRPIEGAKNIRNLLSLAEVRNALAAIN
jgi:MerR family transcriptional regulator, light-induced transcriptional regulator